MGVYVLCRPDYSCFLFYFLFFLLVVRSLLLLLFLGYLFTFYLTFFLFFSPSFLAALLLWCAVSPMRCCCCTTHACVVVCVRVFIILYLCAPLYNTEFCICIYYIYATSFFLRGEVWFFVLLFCFVFRVCVFLSVFLIFSSSLFGFF